MVSTINPTPLEWLTEGRRGPALVVGRSAAAFAAGLQGSPGLTLVDRDREGVTDLLRRAPSAVPLVAAVEALPRAPCSFDRVLLAQRFHRYAPGLALSEFARVLRPGGMLGISYTVRDDSVPWVKRLMGLVRAVDPEAMAGGYGSESLQALTESPYFPRSETRSFRRWVPIDRPGLVAMVARTPAAEGLSDEARSTLLASVGDLYDNAARPPEPLLLPYRVQCWRAEVDHTELTAPLDLPDEGLQIRL